MVPAGKHKPNHPKESRIISAPATSAPLQRARGSARVGYTAQGLQDLHQSGCGKVLLPRASGDVPEAVFINTSGGVTGGDRLAYSASIGVGAKLTVTTQAAERIYRASAGSAEISNTLRLDKASTLEWLPQETILFDGSNLHRRLDVDMAGDASLLAVETLVFGRKAMGEVLQTARLHDAWRIRRGGVLAYADTLRFTAPVPNGVAGFGNNTVLATLLYLAPDAEARLEQARGLPGFDTVETAASAWNGILAVRFLAPDAHPLRRALISFLTGFRGHPLPRVWHM